MMGNAIGIAGCGDRVEVLFEPTGLKVLVATGTSVLDAARRCGIALETPCGGVGICGKCKVKFLSGAPKPTPQEVALLTENELALGYRLACQSTLSQDAVVFIPAETAHPSGRILTFGVLREVAINPVVKKQFVTLPKPSLNDERGDWERLVGMLFGEERCVVGSDLIVDLELLRSLPEVLRQADFKVTLTTANNRLLAVEKGDTTGIAYGMAFDIGTTTLVCYLVDLWTGVTLSTPSIINPQVAYGDDLISRIAFATEREDGVRILHDAVIEAVNELAKKACSEAGVSCEHIYYATFVGNTCMMHLLLGLDVSQLGRAPYVAVIQSAVELEAHKLGITSLPNAIAYVLPCIGGFVGADTVAMILTHLVDGVDVALAIDIGTNSEVVVKCGNEMFAASAAAGPAFEGARIKHGMRAVDGAIYSVSVDDSDIRLLTIGGKPPKGICGTGLVDAVAALIDLGIVKESGKLCSRSEIKSLPQKIMERIVEINGEVAFVLAHEHETESGVPVVLTQRDIRQLQVAKASIRAATETLLKLTGVRYEDLQAVFIAGAFGTFIPKRSAQKIGMLPPVNLELIHSVGNAAGMGAKLALISKDEMERANSIALSVKHVELGTNPIYEEEFFERIRFAT
ncbi:MAG: hypothetical protein RUDDFDWM_001114 [Candidatus Fervidibacterota bacterium]